MKEELIQALEQDLLKSMKNCDIEKLDELLHNDLLFTLPNGQTITKAMDLDTYRSGNMKIKEITSSRQKINLIRNNAVVSAIMEMKGMYFEQSLDGKYRVLRVWQLFENKWKVIAGSSINLNYE